MTDYDLTIWQNPLGESRGHDPQDYDSLNLNDLSANICIYLPVHRAPWACRPGDRMRYSQGIFHWYLYVSYYRVDFNPCELDGQTSFYFMDWGIVPVQGR